MIRRPPRSTRTDTLFPYTTLFRSSGNDITLRIARQTMRIDGKLSRAIGINGTVPAYPGGPQRSEEHTSELQSLVRISYAVFCLKKKNTSNECKHNNTPPTHTT